MKFIRSAADLILSLLAFVLLSLAMLSIYFQTGLLLVSSRSMEPAMKVGDFAVVRNVNVAEIKKSDVVVLPIPSSQNLRYSHRVVEISRELTGYLFRTKGDANPTVDAWQLNVTSKEVPKVIAILPTNRIFALSHIFTADT